VTEQPRHEPTVIIVGAPGTDPLTEEEAREHARQVLAGWDNREIVTINDTLDDRAHAVCDLCGEPHPTWIYPCDSFALPQLGYESVTDWATCNACHDLIEADDTDALFARRMARPNPAVEAELEGRSGEERARAQRAQELYVKTMQLAFMAHRWGQPRPWNPDEGYDKPEAIRVLPRDERGLPISYAQLRVDGRPDFRSLDIARVAECVSQRLCGICGRVLSYWIAFIGGPACQRNRLFKDPAMHPECADYAAKTCPFIAGSKTKYSTRPLPEGPDLAVHVDPNMADHERRPADMFIFTTRRYKIVRKHGAEYIEAAPFASVKRIEPFR
jgi:hypothetical protein